MNDRRVRRGGHGRAPYLRTCLALVFAWACALPFAQAADKALLASGKAVRFEIEGAGGSQGFAFVAISGCRYRLTATPGTLPRPQLALGHWKSEPFANADAGTNDAPAVHVFDAERDGRMRVSVSGFSAQTGDGTLKLETLDARDRPTRAHRRVLGVSASERARVGNLLIGEPNLWDLDVEPGVSYQITPNDGSAGRVHLRVLLPDDTVIGDSEATGLALRSHPPVRFRAPDPLPVHEKLAPVRLEVRGGFDGGGSYGLRMRPLEAGETLAPAKPEMPPTKPAEILEGPVPTFRAGPGDLALLYLPNARNNAHIVQTLRGTQWMTVKGRGQGASARTHQFRGMNWFRPYSAGTFRFIGAMGRSPPDAQLRLFSRKDLGGAPIHLGTGVDPQVRVRVHRKWKLVALGACMPGWDYLFVAVGAPANGVALRIIDPDGKTVGRRGSSGDTYVADTGPSARFRAKQPGLFRLEVRSQKRRVVAAVLRLASN